MNMRHGASRFNALAPTELDSVSLSRRALLRSAPLAAGVAAGASFVPARAWAGGQLEEPLIDSVRSALSSAIANPAPPQPVF